MNHYIQALRCGYKRSGDDFELTHVIKRSCEFVILCVVFAFRFRNNFSSRQSLNISLSVFGEFNIKDLLVLSLLCNVGIRFTRDLDLRLGSDNVVKSNKLIYFSLGVRWRFLLSLRWNAVETKAVLLTFLGFWSILIYFLIFADIIVMKHQY